MTLTDPTSPPRVAEIARAANPISTPTLLKAFLAIAIVTILLRISYSGHLYQDDGLWFTSAEEMLRGMALYRDVYFDKPPVLPLVYAGLFKIFGAHLMTIRLFTIAYSIAVSWVLYLFGATIYGRKTGLLAGAAFAVFSTTYTPGHMQGLNTDLLMTLPYTVGAWLFLRSAIDENGRRRLTLALVGGAAVAIAVQTNPKGLFDLVFFGALLVMGFGRRTSRERPTAAAQSGGSIEPEHDHPRGGGSPADESSYAADVERLARLRLFGAAVVGFVAATIPFLLLLLSTGAIANYASYVWRWGYRYARYYSFGRGASMALAQTAGYFAINNTLFAGLVILVAIVVRRKESGGRVGTGVPEAASHKEPRLLRADIALLVWFLASYLGLALGGRFFGHYFFQVIPALALIGARTAHHAWPFLRVGAKARRTEWVRRCAIGALSIGFALTLVRTHTRTAVLAADWFRGVRSDSTREWFHYRLNHEELEAAAVVRAVEADDLDKMWLPTESLRANGPRFRDPRGPDDYLFVWGYRPEIYYWSGLLPASRFLSTQPLTGVPADLHYFVGSEHSYLVDSTSTRRARIELVADLNRTRPKYLIDELGFFNADLAITSYPELNGIMVNYKRKGSVGRFIVYIRRDLQKKKRHREWIDPNS
jgi:Dolichyl-phosphate-mannose-protein mannosyltransferase